MILDPFVNERENHEIGGLIAMIIENEAFVEEVVPSFFNSF